MYGTPPHAVVWPEHVLHISLTVFTFYRRAWKRNVFAGSHFFFIRSDGEPLPFIAGLKRAAHVSSRNGFISTYFALLFNTVTARRRELTG